MAAGLRQKCFFFNKKRIPRRGGEPGIFWFSFSFSSSASATVPLQITRMFDGSHLNRLLRVVQRPVEQRRRRMRRNRANDFRGLASTDALNDPAEVFANRFV